MKILITNDDGVHAAQLVPLIRWAKKLGDVTVVVPRFGQSAKSHSIDTKNAFAVTQMELEEGITVLAVESTPADCVRYACLELGEKYGLVISGINRGYNLGYDTYFSGTLAAAIEGANRGIPAIAMSASISYYDRAVGHLDEIFGFLKEHQLLGQGLFNINIPDNPKGIRVTRQGGPCFFDSYLPMGRHKFAPGTKPIQTVNNDMTQDTGAARNGYISITPMTTDRTDWRIYEQLKTLSS